MNGEEYVDLIVECNRVKTDLDDAIVAGNEETIRPLYQQYLDLLARKKAVVLDEIPEKEP